MVGGVVPPQRIDEWAIAHEPILIYMTAEMHELVDKIHARRGTHEQPADIR